MGAALAGAALALGAAACAPRAAPPPARDEAEAPDVRTDAEGRRYLVRKLEKRYGVRIDAGRVRSAWGFPLDLAGEDAEHWYYKYYLPADPPPAAATPEPAPSRPAAVAERVAPRGSARLRFEPFGRGLPERGQWRDGFDLADLDGDGRLDLVHGPPRKGPARPQLFLGDGRGGWRHWRETRFPDLPYDYGDARAGDLDGDGGLDLVLAVHLHGFVALLGDGRGSFVRAGAGLDFSERGPAGFSSRTVRLVDFDRDGRLDVLALGEGPRLAGARPGGAVVGGALGAVLYRGLGGGAFERRDRGTGPGEIFGRALALADFDGDGRTDFAAGSGQLGRRDLVRLADGGGLWRAVSLDASRSRAYVHSVAAADFDGDGRAELAAGYASIESGEWWAGIDRLVPEADGRFRREPLVAGPGRDAPRALATGDLDGDGAADLAALDASGATSIFLGDGRGGFTRERGAPPPFAGGCSGSHLVVADLDGDGRDDLVASFAQEREAGGDPDACPSEGGLTAWRSAPL